MTITRVEETMRTDPLGTRLPHDKKYEAGIAFINGAVCARHEAAIPLWDMGFIGSDVTFETATVLRGRYFRLQDHFDRITRSCGKLRLRNPHSDEELVAIFNRLLRLTGLKNASVTWFVTRGLPKPGTSAVHERGNPDAFDNRCYVTVSPYGSIVTAEQRVRGLDIMISARHIRIPPRAVDPTVKNCHRGDMTLSLFEARDHGKEWSVLTDIDGYLTEPPGANIFMIKNGQLYTPDSGCLEGITRHTTLELAQIAGIPAHVEKIHARQLREADDAFITSSAGGIMPVNSVDGIALGGSNGPGELTTRLHNLYWEKAWAGWKSSPVDYEDSASSPPTDTLRAVQN